jgi:hypothetical protein
VRVCGCLPAPHRVEYRSTPEVRSTVFLA